MPKPTPPRTATTPTRVACPRIVQFTSHRPGADHSDASRLSVTEIARTNAVVPTASRTAAPAFANVTRLLRGTSAYVVRAVRRDHSLVTSRIPTTGSSRMEIP